MNAKLLKAFEKLLHDGCYAEAEEQLQQIIRLSPDDWQAKMLFGTCRLFQGDIKTAEQIHKEAEEHYSTVAAAAPEEKKFWQKYHKWIIYGTIAGGLLVLAGAAFLGKSSECLFKYGGSPMPNGGSAYYTPHSCRHKWTCITDIPYQTCEKCGIHDISDGFSSRTPFDHIHEWVTEEWTHRKYCKICSYKITIGIPKKPQNDEGKNSLGDKVPEW